MLLHRMPSLQSRSSLMQRIRGSYGRRVRLEDLVRSLLLLLVLVVIVVLCRIEELLRELCCGHALLEHCVSKQ